jgi:hypothetical protein
MLGLEFPAPPTKDYSPAYVEGEFCELRLDGVLGSSHWTLVGGIIPVDYSRMVIPSERGENLK